MRAPAIGVVLACMFLGGCAGSKTNTDEKIEDWRRLVAVEIPVGTDKKNAMAWFEKRGFHPSENPLEKSAGFEVLLDSVPSKEWYCDKWTIHVVARTSAEGKVEGYDFRALGACL